jgi:cytochrome c oxidase subunit II
LRDRTTLRPSTRRRLIARSHVLALAVGLSGCAGEQSAMSPAGPFAQEPHDLIIIVMLIALVVFVLVQGLIIFSVWRFRERKDDDGSLPEQVHGNTRLEIVWTVIPALILAGIAVPTVQGIFSQMNEPDEEFLTIEVYGHRWWFEYYYPDHDIYTANEMVIPVDMPVRLEMTATDPARSADEGVIHSFWIPRLAGKQDLVPGTGHLPQPPGGRGGSLHRPVCRVLRVVPREHARACDRDGGWGLAELDRRADHPGRGARGRNPRGRRA